jgi:hypothetical protein
MSRNKACTYFNVYLSHSTVDPNDSSVSQRILEFCFGFVAPEAPRSGPTFSSISGIFPSHYIIRSHSCCGFWLAARCKVARFELLNTQKLMRVVALPSRTRSELTGPITTSLTGSNSTSLSTLITNEFPLFIPSNCGSGPHSHPLC